MSDPASHRQIQAIQSQYRQRLLESWPIAHGSRVLEIGCGQGDMTSVLAEAVGPSGHVTAVDIADPSYGSPMTLAEATGLIAQSPVGPRVDFHFNFDVVTPPLPFSVDSFDCVIMAHSSWYFASQDQLAQAFAAVRPWARQLCYAEWDIELQDLAQMPHLLAVLIKGQVEAFKPMSLSNIRTPLHKSQVKDVLAQAGWAVLAEVAVDTELLQDADWEISDCLASSLQEAGELPLSENFLNLIESQTRLLEQIAATRGNRPLTAYSLVAARTT